MALSEKLTGKASAKAPALTPRPEVSMTDPVLEATASLTSSTSSVAELVAETARLTQSVSALSKAVEDRASTALSMLTGITKSLS